MKQNVYSKIRQESEKFINPSTLYLEEKLFGERVVCFGYQEKGSTLQKAIYLVAEDMVECFEQWHLLEDDEFYQEVKAEVLAMDIGVIETTVKRHVYWANDKLNILCFAKKQSVKNPFKLDLIYRRYSETKAPLSPWIEVWGVTKDEKERADWLNELYVKKAKQIP
ncbi:hypothetical protein OGZ51_07155 [Lactococcus lactis]|uniref:Uncharacterized protein n=1 Tax=Lactococcus lactis TaxID=1358 RepID=A0A9X4S4Q3_9LACT|nr:hypothetical protein [Lactococcus lactis]MDG4983918.1 hypothetical protein [Lactococcus lactis]